MRKIFWQVTGYAFAALGFALVYLPALKTLWIAIRQF